MPHPPGGLPSPGRTFRPKLLSRLALTATAAFGVVFVAVEIGSGGAREAALWLWLLCATLFLYRTFRLAEIRVGARDIRVRGLLRSKTLTAEEIRALTPAGIVWQASGGRERTWYLWPYTAIFGPLNDAGPRAEEVWAALERLFESWRTIEG